MSADWVLELECALVEITGWSLVDIDETDIDSLIPFMFVYPKWKGRDKTKAARPKYADEVDWL